MQGKTRTLMRNTLIFTIGSFGSKFIQFFLVPLYTYTLNPAQFGTTELILTAANLLTPIFSISIADGLLRFGLDTKLKKEMVLKCSLIIVAGGTLLSVAASPLIGLNATLGQWVVYFLLILNLRIYRDVFATYLKVKDKNRLFAADSILYILEFCAACIVFLVWLQMGITGYFLAYVVANVLSIVFLLIAGKPFADREHGVDRELLKKLLLYSAPLIANGVAWWITNASDRFMLQWYMTAAAVGIYAIAAKLPLIITTFTGVFSQAWIISASTEYDNEREKQFFSVTFHRFYFILFLSVAALLSVVQPFMRIYVSPEFYEAWQYVPFLLYGTVCSCIAAFSVGVYTAARKNISITVSTLIGAAANVALNMLLIPRMGIMGAAIATFISWGIIAVYRLVDMRRFFIFPINYYSIVLYSVLLMVQCVAVTYFGAVGIAASVVTLSVILYRERTQVAGVFARLKTRFAKHEDKQ